MNGRNISKIHKKRLLIAKFKKAILNTNYLELIQTLLLLVIAIKLLGIEL